MLERMMTIGQLARKCGLTPRAIRYYERLGLLRAPLRSPSNYRLFDADSVERVSFISRCKSLGFSIAEIGYLLGIAGDHDPTCARVEEVTRHHLAMIDAKLQTLMKMRQPMVKCLAQCSGQEVPKCAVLDYLKKSA